MSGLDLYLSQGYFLSMLAASAIAGLCLGGVYELLFALRMLLCPPRPRHAAREGAAPSIGTDGAQGEVSVTQNEDPRQRPEGDRYSASHPSPGFMGDLIFSLVVALTVILLTYYTNDGVLRAPVAVGVGVGFGICHVTIGRLLRRILIPLTVWLRALLRGLLGLTGKPVLWLVKALWRVCRWVLRKTAGKYLSRLRQRIAKGWLRFGVVAPQPPRDGEDPSSLELSHE